MTVTPPDPDKTARVESDVRFTPRHSAHDPQFAPGTVIAGRYRIASILGKGGMGEVYRADDIKLGQAVALKFLPARLARDPILLARLHDEVRHGRQIAHPNVCRIYDIAEWEGAHFVAMEYVDGEDLARLLHRIGRLPHDKAIDIARGVAAGLLAAHAKGILHRDLKPANVMLDSHGEARITDFGLALSATEDQEGQIAGTPAYMAPEQLQGEPASVQTDLYALGLVMYELFTGRRAHAGKTFPDRIRELTSEITVPSNHIRDIDPAVERVILRCLASDPAQRPHSAREVIAALPGGDALGAAMAAGETPSPRTIAAAQTAGSLRPAVAWSLLVFILVALALTFGLQRQVGLLHLVKPKSPDVLADQIASMHTRLGLPKQRFESHGWSTDDRYLSWLAVTDEKHRIGRLGKGYPVMTFWVRREAQPLLATSRLRSPGPTQYDPPQTAPGASTIAVDPGGRLFSLSAVPDASWATRSLDWNPLFAAAGLDPSRFRPTAARVLPPTFANARMAWSGTHPDDAQPIRVEAAAWRGTPVFFRIFGPSDDEADKSGQVPFAGNRFTGAVSIFLFIAITLGVVLAWRNLRLRRGDRQGALRLAAVLFVLQFIATVCSADHALSVSHEARILARACATALVWAGGYCLVYLALEPYVRRRWPDRVISWSRLLAGNWRDPMVGRDILIGIAVGLTHLLISGGFWNLGQMLRGENPQMLMVGDNQVLSGADGAIGWIAACLQNGMVQGLAFMIVLVLFTMLFRRRILGAAGVFGLIMLLYSFASRDVRVLPLFIVLAALLTFMLARFGLLTAATFQATFILVFHNAPPDAISWYTGVTLAAPLFVLALAIWAFRTSLGGRSPWHPALLDD